MNSLHNRPYTVIKALVTLTHIPSGLTATCNAYRSQHENRNAAMRQLRSKYYALCQAGLWDKNIGLNIENVKED